MKRFYSIFLGVALMLMGCEARVPSPLQGNLGKSCYVQFRRDALGASAPNGIGPNVHEYNGSPVYIVGTLKKVQADWIVLTATDPFNTNGQVELMIPMASILSVSFAVDPGSSR